MKTKLSGAVTVLGNNIDSDQLYPGRFLELVDPAEIGSHCLAGVDEGIAARFGQGDFVVAGTNFGCGSSREHAPIALKESGISCVVAASFARIFFRNSINIGLPVLECPEAATDAVMGDIIEVDLDTGGITNVTKGKSYTAVPFPEVMQRIITAGGLVEYIVNRL